MYFFFVFSSIHQTSHTLTVAEPLFNSCAHGIILALPIPFTCRLQTVPFWDSSVLIQNAWGKDIPCCKRDCLSTTPFTFVTEKVEIVIRNLKFLIHLSKLQKALLVNQKPLLLSQRTNLKIRICKCKKENVILDNYYKICWS